MLNCHYNKAEEKFLIKISLGTKKIKLSRAKRTKSAVHGKSGQFWRAFLTFIWSKKRFTQVSGPTETVYLIDAFSSPFYDNCLFFSFKQSSSVCSISVGVHFSQASS